MVVFNIWRLITLMRVDYEWTVFLSRSLSFIIPGSPLSEISLLCFTFFLNRCELYTPPLFLTLTLWPQAARTPWLRRPPWVRRGRMTPSAQTPHHLRERRRLMALRQEIWSPVMGQRQRRSSKVKQKTEIQRITETHSPVQRRMRRWH